LSKIGKEFSKASQARRIALYPIVALGLIGASFTLIKTGRDAVFFVETGVSQLPKVHLWTELGLVAGALIHLAAMKRWGTRRIRISLALFAGAVFIGLAPFVSPRHLTLMQVMFPLVPVLFAALFASSWLLTGDLLEGADPASTRWAYSAVGASALIGAVLGGLLSKVLSILTTPSGLVLAGAALLLVTARVTLVAHRKAHHPSDVPNAGGGASSAGAEAQGCPWDSATFFDNRTQGF
jgi:hypothetical protein